MDNFPAIYRINTATKKLGVSRATIYRLVKTGNLTLVKISDRASGITEESLNQYIANIKPHHNAPKKLGSQVGS